MTTNPTRAQSSTGVVVPSITSSRVARLLLRPEEAAEAIGISRARMYELMADGQIKFIKIGRSRRIPVAELESWIIRELAEQSS